MFPGGRRQRRRAEPADPESVGFVRRRETVLGPGVQLRHHRHAAESRAAATVFRIVVHVRRRHAAATATPAATATATAPAAATATATAPPIFVVVVHLVFVRRSSSSRRQVSSRRRRGRPTVVQAIRVAGVRRRRFRTGVRRVLQKAHRVARHVQVVVERILFFCTFSSTGQPAKVRNRDRGIINYYIIIIIIIIIIYFSTSKT